jgi:hypothetical protein
MAQKTWLGTANSAYTNTANWSEGSIPTTNDTVTVASEAVRDITSGLDQSGVVISTFEVEEGFGYNIGTESSYLQIKLTGTGTNTFHYHGSGAMAKIDLNASALAPIVFNTGNPSTGSWGLALKGTALTGCVVHGGYVGMGVEPGDVTTDCDSFDVYPQKNRFTQLTIGKGVTGNSSDLNITMGGGVVYNGAATGVVNCLGGEYHHTANEFDTGGFHGSSKLFVISPEASGGKTYAANGVEMFGQSKAEVRGGAGALTFTRVILHSGTTWDERIFGVTYSNAIEVPDGLQGVTIILSTGIKITPAEI